MRVYTRRADSELIDWTSQADGQKLIRLVADMRSRMDDDEIESRLYDLIEAGEVAVFAEDIAIMGDIIWLHLPDFAALERSDMCGEAIIYADEAKKFGLTEQEIAEDIVEAGLAYFDDAERIAAL